MGPERGKRHSLKDVTIAFQRLRRAMDWPRLSPWSARAKDGSLSSLANVGAVYITQGASGWCIEKISNVHGGTHQLSPSWRTKRQAFEGLILMAEAIEMYKRGKETSK